MFETLFDVCFGSALVVVNVIDGLLKVAQLTDVHVFDISIAFSLMIKTQLAERGHDFIGISHTCMQLSRS